MNQRQLWTALIAATALVGLAVRLLHLHDPFFRIEEFGAAQFSIYARNYLRLGFAIKGLFPLYGVIGDKPLYYINHGVGGPLLLGIWDWIFGLSEASSRILAVLLSIATTAILYLLGRDLWSRRVGILTAVIYWIMPLSIYMGRLYQVEMPQYICCMLAMWCCLHWSRGAGPRYFWSAAFLMGISTQFDIYGLFISPAFVYLAWRDRERRWGYLLLACMAPLTQAIYFGFIYWCGEMHRITGAASKYAAPLALLRWDVAVTMVERLFRLTAYLPPVLAALAVRRSRPQWDWIVLMAAQPVGMVTVALAMTYPHQFLMLYLLPLSALLSARWLADQSDRQALLGVALIGLLSIPVTRDLYTIRNPQDMAIARDIREHSDDRDLLIAVPSHMAYYIDRPGIVPFFWHWAAPGTYPTQESLFLQLRKWADYKQYRRIILFTRYVTLEKYPIDFSTLFDGYPELQRLTPPGADPQVWKRVDVP